MAALLCLKSTSCTLFGVYGFTDTALVLTSLPEVLEIHPSGWKFDYFTALQQFIFNANRAILERLFSYQGRSTQVSFRPTRARSTTCRFRSTR